MFTGLVEASAQVIERSDSILRIERPPSFRDIRAGSSICVSGTCLSITELDQKSMQFDISEETIKRTTIGEWEERRKVNLERALKADGRFEGHIVQGHIDGVGKVMKVSKVYKVEKDENRETVLTITYPTILQGLIVEKGSIAMDGVSLTVTEVNDKNFSVALIPQTLKETTLGELSEGGKVNLEADILGKYVQGGKIVVQ